MYRGRLINPFTAVIGRLDTVETRANDLGGEVAQGYDDIYREPTRVTDDATGEREDARVEREIRIKCQVEDDLSEVLRMTHAGNNPQSALNLVFHYGELERRGLVDSNGLGVVKTRDRLIKIYDCRGKLAQEFRNPPGMFATHAKAAGFGIGRKRNLWIVTFEERELVPREAS